MITCRFPFQEVSSFLFFINYTMHNGINMLNSAFPKSLFLYIESSKEISISSKSLFSDILFESFRSKDVQNSRKSHVSNTKKEKKPDQPLYVPKRSENGELSSIFGRLEKENAPRLNNDPCWFSISFNVVKNIKISRLSLRA